MWSSGSGVIPPLLDRDTWDRLRAVLGAPRGPSSGGATVRKHYLTGLVKCGLCGRSLVARPDARGTTRYVCAVPRGCGRIVVAKQNLEPLIAEAIAIRLDSDAFRQAVEATQDQTETAVDVARLRADEEALEEANRAYFVERAITKPEWQAVRSNLNARIESARRRLEAASSRAGLDRLASIDVAGQWESQPVIWKHDVAALLIDSITVKPAPRRGTQVRPVADRHGLARLGLLPRAALS